MARAPFVVVVTLVGACKSEPSLGHVDDPRIEYAKGALANPRGGWKKTPSEFPSAAALLAAFEEDMSDKLTITKVRLLDVRGWCPTRLCPPPHWEIDLTGSGVLAHDTYDEVPAAEWLVACGLPAEPVPALATAPKNRVFRSRNDKGRPMVFDGNVVIGKEPDGRWHIGRSSVTSSPRDNPDDRPGMVRTPEILLGNDRFQALCEQIRRAPAGPVAPGP